MNWEIIEIALLTAFSGGYPHFSIVIHDGTFRKCAYNLKLGTSDGLKTHERHSEYILIEYIKQITGKIKIIQLHPPCKECLKALVALDKEIEIEFLFDPKKKLGRSIMHINKKVSIHCIDKDNEFSKKIIEYAWVDFYNRMHTYGHYCSRVNFVKKYWDHFDEIKWFQSAVAGT